MSDKNWSQLIRDHSRSCLTLSLLLHASVAAGLVVIGAELLKKESPIQPEVVEFTTAQLDAAPQAGLEPMAAAPQVAETPAPEPVSPVVAEPIKGKAKPLAKAPAKEPALSLPKKPAPVEPTPEIDSETEATAVLPVVEEDPVVEDLATPETPVVATTEEVPTPSEPKSEPEPEVTSEAETPAPTKEEEPLPAVSETPQTVEEPSETTPETTEEVPAALVTETAPTLAAAAVGPVAAAPVAAAPVAASPATEAAGSGKGTSPEMPRSYLDLRQKNGNVPPQYPVPSRRLGQQGSVVLNYFVTKEGRVRDIRIIKSSGHASLDQSAITAISRYQYHPGQEGWTQHPVNFSLKGPARPLSNGLRTNQASR